MDDGPVLKASSAGGPAQLEPDGGTRRADLPGIAAGGARFALAALVAGAAATAFNPVFVRLSDLEPGASAFHRMTWALPLMLGWMMMEARASRPVDAPSPVPASPRDHILLALCGLFFACDLIALHWSITLTKAANAILFLNAQPLYVVAGAWLLFGEKIRPMFLAGTAIALFGAAVTLGDSADIGGDRVIGDGLGIAAGLFYAGFILAASRLRRRYSSAIVNAWTCLVASPLLLVAALAAGQSIVPPTGRDWGLMIGLGVISQAAGQGLIVWGLAHLPTSFSSLVLLSAPIASAFFAWLFLAEPLTAVQGAGMAAVLCGIYIAQRSREK